MPHLTPKSIVSRRRAADSAVAGRGEGTNDTIALEMEAVLHYRRFVSKTAALR